MSDANDIRYDSQDYTRAGKIAAHLAKGGYDLSLSERTALRQASAILMSWAGSMPRSGSGSRHTSGDGVPSGEGRGTRDKS